MSKEMIKMMRKSLSSALVSILFDMRILFIRCCELRYWTENSDLKFLL